MTYLFLINDLVVFILGVYIGRRWVLDQWQKADNEREKHND